mgnify:CR=1 FL=1
MMNLFVCQHVGTQVKAYLATKNNRFEFVYTPKHGSWLNLIDNLGTSENSPKMAICGGYSLAAIAALTFFILE